MTIDKQALLGADKHANQHRLSRLIIEANSAELRAIAEAVEQYTDQLIAALEAEEKRIAELERSETQLINERDYAESALNDAYKAVMGQAPEWSNWFSFENAIDEMELACEQWRNQTDDVIRFRQRIAELEAREILLPERSSMLHRTDFHEDYHTVMAYKVSDVIAAIRAADIKVKES